MDALHPRLLVHNFAAVFRFYDAVLPELIGASRTRGDVQGPYASWDVGAQGALMLFDRSAMAAVLGTEELPAHAPATQDRAMLVSRVGDVDAGYRLCMTHGAASVVPPTDRPDWGPTMRTAHLRDPEGHLIELQSY
ncbi:VOC family protein [Actinacidiphila acidipaludis]|uniref:Glyoxalase/bleomycin resistance/extradiol dioxygenase family protein n=1 Tax=Actinacidiphila acidipaludis TaxID=2873382 RepID=A0ABS7Q6M8_9ACTN|nr:VOC family protein [Streptomyces acidipaludis]MBY8878795.1 glyoxalase/bleomycin resistance/extradiol dioxygenase family protein [Streptomyces acidipaludis]